MDRLTQQDFERLLEFRVTLRRFQRWSEDQAKDAGLTHVQHQLLVAIKGHPGGRPPTVGDLAGYLLLRPHSAVELVDRAEAAGLVERTPDREDGRVVRVRLTPGGEEILQRLTRAHLDRLHELATVLDEFVTRHDGAAVSAGRVRVDDASCQLELVQRHIDPEKPSLSRQRAARRRCRRR
jgi:DNA-binding MarR family transcriptional regulator